ncbi:MAG: TauD/TfdA family dioxygenase [Hyphomicrobiales bacterium]|nr:TauD/TfdA family dioxygenase [Hyphomicrobiales bacterium]MDE2016727.1 TauD/TfdA family dioxygenase [Hyphomicrobiales bacterium]
MESMESVAGKYDAGAGAPPALDDEEGYLRWRGRKLSDYPSQVEDVRIEVADFFSPTPAEHAAIAALCSRANLAIAVWGRRPADDATQAAGVLALGASLGLTASEDQRSMQADGLVRIEEADAGGRAGYIPYTNKPISWHTDGYYNYHGPARGIQAMTLYCVRDAERGGLNGLLDPEIVYLRLRDEDPALVAALSREDAMTIPENAEDDGALRPANVGPVFYRDPDGQLAMRYTARKRSIAWRDDAATRRAVAALERVCATEPLVVRTTLRPGDALVCNNVLHDRGAFTSSPGARRLLYRVRYRGRIR